MPILHNIEIKAISDDDFQQLDYEVMGLAFSIHRDMGRFWNEKIYQNELAYRCQKSGFRNVATEIPIRVSYRDFMKSYFVDLMINSAVIYGLKAAQSISGVHHKQALDYLFLLGMQRGKIINMQPSSVEHRFVSTGLTPEKRHAFVIDDTEWHNVDEDGLWLKNLMTDLLNEWGAFLGIGLFYEAIYHFRGGDEQVVKELEIKRDSHSLGAQRIHMLNPGVAFKISSITKGESFYAADLRRFVRFASLKALQWINFNHHQIMFKTIFP